MEPIMEFEDEKQAYLCMNEWKHRLFLDDWIIKIELLQPDDMPDMDGHNSFVVERKSCIVNICIPNNDIRGRIEKFCAEKTLVHELLHCKYNIVEEDNTYEGVLVEIHQHTLLEQMAKSLIMAKYNLDLNWFKNFKEK